MHILYCGGLHRRRKEEIGLTERKIIAVSSVTYAMKGSELLAKNKIKRRITKLKPDKTKRGCAYGISVDSRDIEDAVRILRLGGVNYSEIADG